MQFEYWKAICNDCTIGEAYSDKEAIDLWAALHTQLSDHDVDIVQQDGDPRDAGALTLDTMKLMESQPYTHQQTITEW